jgi:hypothetical protein
MSPFLNMRRFSRSSGIQNQPPSTGATTHSPPTGYSSLPGTAMLPNGTAQQDDRPVSSGTDASFDFASRPLSNIIAIPTSSTAHLSRTDQVVLRHYWELKAEENRLRDLHFLKFPYFSTQPTHKELIPYCEIYHLVKTSPGAKIISLGSATGVYIGYVASPVQPRHPD